VNAGELRRHSEEFCCVYEIGAVDEGAGWLGSRGRSGSSPRMPDLRGRGSLSGEAWCSHKAFEAESSLPKGLTEKKNSLPEHGPLSAPREAFCLDAAEK